MHELNMGTYPDGCRLAKSFACDLCAGLTRCVLCTVFYPPAEILEGGGDRVHRREAKKNNGPPNAILLGSCFLITNQNLTKKKISDDSRGNELCSSLGCACLSFFVFSLLLWGMRASLASYHHLSPLPLMAYSLSHHS